MLTDEFGVEKVSQELKELVTEIQEHCDSICSQCQEDMLKAVFTQQVTSRHEVLARQLMREQWEAIVKHQDFGTHGKEWIETRKLTHIMENKEAVAAVEHLLTKSFQLLFSLELCEPPLECNWDSVGELVPFDNSTCECLDGSCATTELCYVLFPQFQSDGAQKMKAKVLPQKYTMD